MSYRYGLTIEDYNVLVEKQNGLCAICGLPEKTIRGGKLLPIAIDHNHRSGEIRGLLCQSCNRAIGLLKADTFGTLNLIKAIGYLNDKTK